MTQDEIVEMTRQAGGFDATPKFLETFAKLVAQHERESCAKVCESIDMEAFGVLPVRTVMITNHCAEAIRARSKE